MTPPVPESCVSPRSVVALLLVMFAASWGARAQQPATSPAAFHAPLTTEQVVRNLIQMNLHRAEALHSYEGSRTYRVEYRGFPGTRSAEMAVNVKYLSPNSKDFIVQSATGSDLIIDKVFRKLLEAERESLAADNQRRAALTEENYRFTLIGYESVLSGAAYVLAVEPRTKDKFLYRGKIWVDAEDFAVVRLSATPAKNPSFWTKGTEIEQVYQKIGNFWLPASNRSVTAIRLGGHAELTILYKDYKITGESQVNRLAALRSALPRETGALQK